MRRAIASILVILAMGIVLAQGIGGATPPSTTADGYGYLLWAQADAARIWVLDGDGGLRHEHTLHYPSKRSADPADVWRARELVVAPDGTKRLLWTNLARGRAEVWTLNAALEAASVRAFQASEPSANWYATSFEKRPGGGRMAWFNAFVGSAVVWRLNATEDKMGANVFTPAADAGAWVPIEYGGAPDGSQRLVWTYTWNGTGPRGGRSVIWFLDGNDQKLGSQILTYDPDTYLRSYRFENDGRLRFLIADDQTATGKVCTTLADTTVVPTGTGWGPGQCKTFGPEPGWILRSYAGNTPLDLSGQERALIEREAARLQLPEESFVTPGEVRVGDMLLRTATVSLEGSPGSPVYGLDIDKWPSGRIALRFPTGASSSFVQNVLDACRRWADVAGVSCVPGPGPFLDVRHASGGVCLGTLGYAPNAYLTSGPDGICAAHEFGHVLGMVHTHQREDRDQYVTVHPEQANPDYVGAIRDRYRVPWGFGPYDYFSVMHYEPYAFSVTGLPTITRHDGSTNLGGAWVPTTIDAGEAQRLYPGQGTVSPASAFLGTPTPPPPPGDEFDLFLSNVVVDGQSYTPSYLPVFQPGQTIDMVLVVTNNGRAWEAAEQAVLTVTHWGNLEILNGGGANSLTIPIVDTVPPEGQVGIPVQARVSSALSAGVIRMDVALYAEGHYTGVQRAIYLYVLPGTVPVPGPIGHLQATAVLPDLSTVAPGQVLPFRVKVTNPTSQPEVVRVRGYLDGPIVTNPQPSFQVGVVEPGATSTFAFSATAPDVEGTMRAYGQLYTLVGTNPYAGNESAAVSVVEPPACGGCDFSGVACGEEGVCVNNPSQGCGQVLVCTSPCVPVAAVEEVFTVPSSIPAHSSFTVTARVKNLAAQINTLSVRGYTDLTGASPADTWRTETLLPFETRNVTFGFQAPASGTFQAHTQLYCAGDPLPFVGNSSTPATVGGGGGPYGGEIPSADFVHLAPDPALAGQTVTAHGRVHNHNNYTSSFYLRPYTDEPHELARVLVTIPPHGDVTETFTFPVPNTPGATLGVHFQVEHEVGTALSGASAAVAISNVSNPTPTPTNPPEETCPGPNDGDSTNCPVHNGHQTYRSCQSCRSAHTWASYCQQKTNLNFCWKPMP